MSDRRQLQSEQLGYELEATSSEDLVPVTCLGQTFANDAARREHFLQLLREKLEDREFRKAEGFPLGTDEDLLGLSDPPYYTACPNPFIADFIAHHGKSYDPATDSYRREPFATDTSEGKNDPIYSAHSYHTKVPHRAIMRYILHYTEPGDIVVDGFCGTGMTGVAAQLCGDRQAVEALGYRVDELGIIHHAESSGDSPLLPTQPTWQPFSRLGARCAVLNDLSPAATFIAYNYNAQVNVMAFAREAKRILREVESECGWMYETLHSDGRTLGKINYTVWSDVFVCPDCSCEVVFWETAVDKKAGKVSDEFPCTGCGALLTKRRMERAWVSRWDKSIDKTMRQAKQVPVLINYSIGSHRYEKTPDSLDLALIAKLEEVDIPHWFPTDRLPEGEESLRNDNIGLTHVHHFYTKRNLWALSALYSAANKACSALESAAKFFVQYSCLGFSKLARYAPTHYSQVNQYFSGTLYVGTQQVEVSPHYILKAKAARMVRRELARPTRAPFAVSTADATACLGPSASVDYIFTDPPFGGNLVYSELNFFWEAWLKVLTNNKSEAIENKFQGKALAEYQQLMTAIFSEYYRVLKPGRWMTVAFHNTRNSVSCAIEEALQRAGFVIADVRAQGKQQGTFKQVTKAEAAKQDLVISCYKPNGGGLEGD